MRTIILLGLAAAAASAAFTPGFAPRNPPLAFGPVRAHVKHTPVTKLPPSATASERDAQTVLAVACGMSVGAVLTLAPDGTAARLAAAIGVQAIVCFCYLELTRHSVEMAELQTGTGMVSKSARSGPLRMQLSEEEIQAKLDQLSGRSGSTPQNAEAGGGGGGPALPPLLGEIGLFAVAIVIFAGALVVSLS